MASMSTPTAVPAGTTGGDPPVRGIFTAGRFFIAVSLFVFGAQHFIYAQFVSTLIPAWIPARLFFAYFVGAAFVAAGLSFATKIRGQLAAKLLGLQFFIFVAVVHVPRIVTHLNNANEWTSGFVALVFCGLSWILGYAFARDAGGTGNLLGHVGRILFLAGVLAFGVQHFIYLKFAGGIGPPWITVSKPWIVLAAAVLLVSSVSILAKRKPRLWAFFLGALNFGLFAVWYVPHIIMQPHNPGPWTSGFEILSIWGGAWVLASILPA
jgi:uncharacterized membrane protein